VLYRILEDHPEACLSEPKELDFFSYFFHFGFQWYEDHFKCTASAKAIGEISPSYLHDYLAPKRAADYEPRLKVIVSLRDPIERALSQHKHMIRIGFFKGPDFSFEAGLKANPTYIEQGLGAKYLDLWLASFPQEQLLIVFMDDIRADAGAVARQVYRFLGISEDHQPAALNVKANPSYVVNHRALDDFVIRCRGIARGLGLRAVWKVLARTPLRWFYESLNRIESDTVVPPLRPETIDRLHQALDVETRRLARMTGRELPWTADTRESRGKSG